MKTITQYKEDIRILMKKATDIDTKCVAENRDPSDSEISLKNEMMDAVEDLRKTVATMERQERISSALESPESAPASRPSPQAAARDNGRAQDRFGSFGEQMAAVMQAGQPGGRVDPRLLNVKASASGLNETVPSDGGLI